METAPSPVSPQRFLAENSVPYGDPCLRTRSCEGGRLGYVHRPLRRILPYSDASDRQEVAPLHLQRGHFLEQYLWPLTGSLGLLSNRERAVLPHALQGCSPEGLFRRLARLGIIIIIIISPVTGMVVGRQLLIGSSISFSGVWQQGGQACQGLSIP